jgi:hypothetical protein
VLLLYLSKLVNLLCVMIEEGGGGGGGRAVLPHIGQAAAQPSLLLSSDDHLKQLCRLAEAVLVLVENLSSRPGLAWHASVEGSTSVFRIRQALRISNYSFDALFVRECDHLIEHKPAS